MEFLSRFLGFYWDDIDFVWFYKLFGISGLVKYFLTGRPVLGLFYEFNMFILGDVSWHWQIFSLLARWMCATGLYLLVSQLWKNRKEAAFIAAAFFLVYPCFSQQSINIIYGHFLLY